MSLKNFSLLEAVELAINMEEEGVRFYTRAAQIGDPEVQKLFLLLRDKEYEHINTFRKIHGDLEGAEGIPDASLYITDPEISAYFRAYVESTVFPTKGAADRVLATVSGPLDALRIGLQVEKDSILYYQELSRHSPYPAAMEALQRIIGEERKHFMLIHDLWEKIRRQKS